nr:hypothetical protein [Rhodococcus sp. (in: high G+C Gram-positive bacteria)]
MSAINTTTPAGDLSVWDRVSYLGDVFIVDSRSDSRLVLCSAADNEVIEWFDLTDSLDLEHVKKLRKIV